MNVVISGLTAAGKTTHARLLAERFNMRYVSASEVLAARAGIEVDSQEHWWLEHGRELSALRERSDEADNYVDHVMIRLAEETDGQVFDAWALPWTTSARMLRIWLASDHASRYRKCQVSHLAERSIPLDECQRIVDTKDAESRRIFRRLHSFDLYTDHDVFDVIMDLSGLIPEATTACAQRGIAVADAYLSRVVGLSLDMSSPSDTELREAAQALPAGAIVRSPTMA